MAFYNFLIIIMFAIAPDAAAQYRRTEVKNVPGTILEVNSTPKNSSGTFINPATRERQLEMIGQLNDIYTRQTDRTNKVRRTDGTRDTGIEFNGFDIPKTALETQVFEEGFSQGIDTVKVWTSSVVLTGTITVTNSAATFQTSSSGSLAQLTTQLPHSFLHGFSNIWRVRLKTGDAGVPGVVREWGMFDSSNGYFFRLSGSSFSAVVRRVGIDTVIPSSSFIDPFVFSSSGTSYAIQYLDGNRVLFYVNNTLVFQAGSATGGFNSNLVATSQLKTRLRIQQTSTTSATMEFYGLAVIREGVPFTFDSAGNLRVSGGSSQAPAGTTQVSRPVARFVNLNPNQTIDNFYTITSGKTLTVQVINASAESAGTGKSVIVTVFEDPTGTGTPLTRIRTLMGNNFNEERVIDRAFSGDGTRRILIRTEQVGSSSMRVNRFWQGFEQ